MLLIFPNIYQKLNRNQYNITITNHNHITPANSTSTMVTIIITKVNNIHVTNNFQYDGIYYYSFQNRVKFMLQIPPLSIPKPYNIPVTNPFPNTPATPSMVTIIIAKPYNIHVTNTFQYPYQII